MDNPNIYVVDDRGNRYSSRQVGGRLAMEFPGGMPAAAQWFGWHEFAVPNGARTITLYYPGRQPLIVDLTK